jgi:activating signal cointegrator complex subunit 3
MLELYQLQVLDAVKNGHQAMVFVHSRKDTVKTGRILVRHSYRDGLGFL